MAAPNDNVSMALFCDFENIALGVRDAQYEKFDIRPVLERLLAKGSIVVKKAYCDWERYKGFKAAMHEANFELIEIPHVRQSGKNSADIRMVVDALDLCYTKSHVDTFVIISGDSDFSPLVSKLRENAKRVIGVGVKQSCSDLLVTNCDEFIYYDDLVRDRDSSRGGQRREREKRSPEEEAKRSEKQEERKSKAVDIVSTTFVDLIADRGESERIWASVLKEVVKRRNPGFNENYYGFRSFGNLLEEAASRGLLGFGRDDKGAYVFRAPQRPAVAETESAGEVPVINDVTAVDVTETAKTETPAPEVEASGNPRRRGGRRSRNGKDRAQQSETVVANEVVANEVVAAGVVETPVMVSEVAAPAPVAPESAENVEAKPRRGTRRPRKAAEAVAVETPVVVEVAAAVDPEPKAKKAPSRKAKDGEKSPAKAKRPARTPRARKPMASEAAEN
ncbi:NYN domain-containing protein [Quatrionicoccus australiensis]|uniref:NYN domain-containing protein n=1 Tax=Quatrionicoccus australiensis TaxID=138118 RepID=UPI001CFBBB34|nr:NYN domain-containing protein [Quatrionicoccus australiensis]MCB4361114.1 NYN domain-containing protein [Quatrionicoccus australiensis]